MSAPLETPMAGNRISNERIREMRRTCASGNDWGPALDDLLDVRAALNEARGALIRCWNDGVEQECVTKAIAHLDALLGVEHAE